MKQNEMVDWFQMIVDLDHAGFSATITALSIDVPKTTLLGWKKGSRPKYEEGGRLIDLWSMVLKKGRDHVPMIC